MSPTSARRSTRLHRPNTSMHNHADDPYTIPHSSEDGDDDDDDDEFIPANISPHKIFAGANGPSLRPPRPFKRHHEDDTHDHTTSSKRPKNNGIASSPLRDRSQPEPQTDTGLASPAPSRALTAPNNRASRSASGESPSDNDVDIALFNLVNSKMIKRNPVEAPPSPSQQLLQEEARQEEPEQEVPELDDFEQELSLGSAPINAEYAGDNVYSSIEIDGDKDLSAEAMPGVDLGAIEGPDESGSEGTLEQDDDHSMPQNDSENDGHYYDYLAESGSSANQDDNSAMAMPGIQHGHHDPYEVPESPDRGDHGETAANSQQSRRDAEILDAQLAGEVNGANGQGSGQANAEDMDIDSDVDFEVESHLDLGDDKMSLQEHFAQDLERFRSRSRAGDFEDSLLFEPSETTSSTTIHLSSENVETIRKIIKRKGWVGRAKDADGKFLDWETKLHNDWKRKLQNHSESVTAVGNHLCGYTEKVERLVQLAFRAPSQEKRNQMFREHIGFLEHCFVMLEKCIVFIHDVRLPFLKKQGSSSKSMEKLEVMIEEMANFHIPTLFRLLTRIWAPCSKNERRSSFDSFAIQLLARVVGWIEQLYRPFIREVREMEDSASLKNTRKEFETPMEQLRVQLTQAPELLEQEEKSQATQKARRQEQLRKQLEKQRERELQMQQEEEERVEARRRQNQEVARFLRQAHERSFKAGRRQSEDALSHQERPRRKRDVSQQVHSSPAAIGVEETVWREEEKLALILKLQDSFSTPNPRLPDLYDTAIRIGHTPDETVDKAREVLLAMVSRGSKGSLSEEEVHNRVQIIMRQWE